MLRFRSVIPLLVLLLTGCSEQLEEMRERYRPSSMRDAYIHALQETGIAESRIGERWLAEGDAVMRSPVEPTLPYVEEGRLIPTDIMAVAYRLSLTRGEQVIVEAASPDGFDVFADLYELQDAEGLPPKRLSSADSTGQLTWDVRRTDEYVLRIQPEILAEGGFRVSIRTDASLVFPVSGLSSGAIQSFFGDSREGGRRDHHGVDIFAPRGTPVVAVTEGRINSVRETGLGGKQVWLRDAAGHNYYYAHLDSQLVREGMRVSPGDTLGLVGNTGNARTTPPHLHFGIYQRGPHDPWPFVYSPTTRPSRITVNPEHFGSWRSTSTVGVTVRSAPTSRSSSVIALDGATTLHIIGGSASWYHVRLEDGRNGYLPADEFDQTLAVTAPARDRRPAGTVGS